MAGRKEGGGSGRMPGFYERGGGFPDDPAYIPYGRVVAGRFMFKLA